METLENLYDKPPILSNFVPRKYNIEHKKILLLGAKKSGITSIIVDFLSNLDKKDYLYIDLHDTRIKSYDFSKLNDFVKKKSINYLIVENFTNDFVLPKVNNIILSSHEANLDIKGFAKLHVNGLDFEEFIGFMQKNFNIEHIFKLYANSGILPKSTQLNEYENKMYLQEVLDLSLNDEIALNLFYMLAKKQAETYSLFQAYSELKLFMKVSKDKLYKKAQELENLGLISFVQKFSSSKSPKKVYLNNFAFKNAISYEKDFVKRFENMVFCQLKEKEIYYTEQINFYLPTKNQAILSIPFLPIEFIFRRIDKLTPTLKKLNIKSLQIITMGNEGKGREGDMEYEILPFWQWALVL